SSAKSAACGTASTLRSRAGHSSRRASVAATSTPRSSSSARMEPVSVDRGVSWLPAMRTTGASGSASRSRWNSRKAKTIAVLVGRTAWKRSPATSTASGRAAMTPSTAARKAAATSASRWLMPPGVWRWYWRKPRWASARWAISTAGEWRRHACPASAAGAAGGGARRASSVRVARGPDRRDPAPHRRLSPHPAAERGEEERHRVVGAPAPGGGEGPAHVLLPAPVDEGRDPVRRHLRAQGAELPRHRGREREVGLRREARDPLAAREHRGAREPDEDRLREVRMAEHQLALGQGGELGARGGGDRPVSRGGELVGVHPPVDGG